MTKDNSGRSSAAGSTHTPSPLENGLDGPAREPEQSNEATPNMSRSTSLVAESTKPADTDTSVVRAAESQPMTTSNSASSNPTASDGVGGGTGAAAPYGTRSRNRTGANRPNYAEDKELDTEFEVAASWKEGRKAARGADSASATAPDAGRSANTARKIQGSEADQVVAVQSNSKDAIPGTSTFSANPAQAASTGQSSKKRKATGQPATSNLQHQLQVPSQGFAPAPAVTRGASMAAQGVARETNMLSFDDCGSRLKDKKLFADDGTILEVNGE